jgi:hypothetical protein
MENNQIIDGSSPFNPYIKHTLFAASANSDKVKGNNRFVLPLTGFISNKALLATCVFKVNFKDGNGWQLLVPGLPLNVDYEKEGVKVCKLQMTYLNKTYTAKFKIEVTQSAKDDFYKDNTRDASWTDPQNSNAVAHIFLRDNNNGQLNKPVIISEGFDPNDNLNEERLYEILNNERDNASGLLQQLNAAGYDVVILNWERNYASIQNNAGTLRRLINWVNATKMGNEKLVVAGASMGGLIARYTLANMEKNLCEDHNTRLYLSYDSPHKGANVPVGIQYIIDDFNDLTFGFNADIRDQFNAVNSTAARQMLRHHYSTSSGAHSSHTDFYNELNNLGYPEGLRKVAVTMGNTFNNTPGTQGTSPSSSLARYFDWQRGINSGNGMLVDVYARTTPNQTTNQTIARTRFTNRTVIAFSLLFWDVRWTIDVNVMNRTHTYGGTGSHDYQPGGYIFTQEEAANAVNNSNLGWGSATNPGNRRHHTIVSTNSALDLNSSAFTFNKSLEDILTDGNTPFDALYAKTANGNFPHTSNVVNISFVQSLFNEITTNIPVPNKLPSTLTTTYNLTEVIDDEIPGVTIGNGGKLYVNAYRPSGYEASPLAYPTSGSAFNVTSSSVCFSSDVTVLEGGEFILGEENPQHLNSAIVTFQKDAELSVLNGGKIVVNNNSSLIIDASSQLRMSGDSEIELKGANSVIRITSGANFVGVAGVNEKLKISGNGSLILSADAVGLIDRGILELNDNVSVFCEGRIIFDSESKLSLNGNNTLFKLVGTLEVAGGNDFEIVADNLNDVGEFILEPNSQNEVILGSPGSMFILPESGATNPPVLKVYSTTNINVHEGERNYLEEFVAINTSIELYNNSYLKIASPRLHIENSYIKGGTLIIDRVEAESEEPRLLEEIIGCTFDNTEVIGTGEEEVIEMLNNDFVNESHVWGLMSAGFIIRNSDFTENSTASFTNNLKVRVTNCDFTGDLNETVDGAINVYGGYDVQLRSNSISGFERAIVASDNASVGMGCNNITGNTYGLLNGEFALPFMNGYYGKNSIVNNSNSNIIFLAGRKIDFTNGRNRLYNNNPLVPSSDSESAKGTIMSGLVLAASICPEEEEDGILSDGIVPTYEATGNQWSSTNTSHDPQDIGNERFPLEFLDMALSGNECVYCDVEVTDALPREYKFCSAISVRPDVVSNLLGGSSNQVCPSCPVLTAPGLFGERLNTAVDRVVKLTSFQGGNDDRAALELLQQILTSNYVLKTEQVYDYLRTSYFHARSAASALVLNGDVDFAKGHMDAIFLSFNPKDFAGDNTVDLFGMILDRAEFSRKYGDLNSAITALQEILPYVADRLELYIEKKIELYETELAYIKGDISFPEFASSVGVGGTPIWDIDIDPIPPNPCWIVKDPRIFDTPPNPQNLNGNQGGRNNFFESAESFGNFSLFPNPSNGNVKVKLGSSTISVIVVRDVLGKTVFTKENTQTEGGTVTMNLSNLPKGVYVIEALGESNIAEYKEKLILQ